MRQGGRRQGLESQVISLDAHSRELGRRSASAAENLISRAGEDRRQRRPELQRMLDRVRAEVRRLETETSAAEAPLEVLDARLRSLERQVRDVVAERQEWMRESACGRRRRAEDVRTLEWLREEQERLTAELLRFAEEVQRRPGRGKLSRLRRVWKALRISGT